MNHKLYGGEIIISARLFIYRSWEPRSDDFRTLDGQHDHPEVSARSVDSIAQDGTSHKMRMVRCKHSK